MRDDLESDSVEMRPQTWSEAFPWVPGKAGSEAWEQGPWWELAIDDADVASRDSVLGNIANLAILRLGRWPLGEVFPGLPSDIVLRDLDLPSRARTVLVREGLLTGSDLADVRVDDLLAFRSLGVGTASAILRALAAASASSAQPEIVARPEPAGGLGAADARGAWLGDLIRDLAALATWNHSIGDPLRSALAELPPGAPSDVIEAHDRVFALSAADLLPAGIPTVADQLDAAIAALDERFRLILADRLFAWNAKTLQEIGDELGVTRQRAQQLEVKARALLSEFASADNAVGRVSELVRAEIQGVRPLDELVRAIPALGLEVRTLGQPAWRVIDVLDDAYEIADGWCTRPSFEAARRDTAVFLDEVADAYGVVRLAEVVLSDDATSPHPWLPEWLEYLGYEVRDQYVLTRTTSLNDVAAAVLSIEGGPLPFGELHQRVGRGAAGSLRNQLSVDPTFARIDRQQFALAEWGLDSYANIRGEIGKLIVQAGGEMPLVDVIDSLVDRFNVSPNSVSAYAGSSPYQIANGVVRHQIGQLAGGGKNPAKVAGYYRRGDDWLYRTTVTYDHLRGSGWPASTALSTILGMAPGEYAELPSRLGPQRFSYKSHQPSYGSIKRFLEDMDLGIGDEIFLIFRRDGTFDVEQLPEEPAGHLGKALRLVGADMSLDVDAAVDTLAFAIKYAEGADLASIAEGYKARREQLIHDLILDIEPDQP